MNYLTKAGVKFIKESRTGRQHPPRGRAWRRTTSALHKARALLQGHNLPRVPATKPLTPSERKQQKSNFQDWRDEVAPTR